MTGEVLDVVVDLRKGSPTYGQSESFILSEHNRRQLLVPRGFAHGFATLTPNVNFMYKCDNYYNAEADAGIVFDDKALEIDWQIDLLKRLFQIRIETFLHSKNLKRAMILSMGKWSYNIFPRGPH